MGIRFKLRRFSSTLDQDLDWLETVYSWFNDIRQVKSVSASMEVCLKHHSFIMYFYRKDNMKKIQQTNCEVFKKDCLTLSKIPYEKNDIESAINILQYYRSN